MSHLARHQNKDAIKKLLILVVIIGAVGFLAIQVGLKSLINATLLINEATSNSEDTTADQLESDFFGTLQLDEPVSATNSAEIIVTGSSSEFDTLQFFINNTKVEEKSAKESFEEKIGKLKVGENTLYVVARTKNGKNKKDSSRYTVYYKNEPPKLEITMPKDGDNVTKQDLQIEGKTDANVSVSVNNQPIVVDYQGNFKKSLRLKEGENKLQFVAEDEAGNKKEATMTIRYQRDE